MFNKKSKRFQRIISFLAIFTFIFSNFTFVLADLRPSLQNQLRRGQLERPEQVKKVGQDLLNANTSRTATIKVKPVVVEAPVAAPSGKNVFFFAQGDTEGMVIPDDLRADILGGKGAGLQEMLALGLPVPPGFTISTRVGVSYLKHGSYPDGLEQEVRNKLSKLDKLMKKESGDADNLLLVSVRSGAKKSMPGMMDTILNVRLNDENVEILAAKTGNAQFAYDSYRQLIEGFSKVVLGIEEADDKFREIINQVKQEEGLELTPATDKKLSADALKNKVIPRYKELVLQATGKKFPQDPDLQVNLAIEAVFKSWNSQRAKDYRAQNKISDDLGTACNIQAMVFGNMGDDSGTGVYFTRDGSTGENVPSGNFLPNFQGEAVVSGTYNAFPIKEMPDHGFTSQFEQLIKEIGPKLENAKRDLRDIEFTIQKGRLWILQDRAGKRTGHAAVKIAVDMVKEGKITREQALLRVASADLAQLLADQVNSEAAEKGDLVAESTGGSIGAAWGMIAFDADDVAEFKGQKENVILLRKKTEPDDFKAMVSSNGIGTVVGGDTSHAAIVCKSERKVGIFGLKGSDGEEVVIDYSTKTMKVGNRTLKKGEIITIDATNKRLYFGKMDLIPGGLTEEAEELLTWADENRRLGVRANADTPAQARKARENGAKGIGLLRLEHWIQVSPELQRLFHLWYFSEDKQTYLDQIEALLKKDMKEILKVMEGYPVIVRTLDPPLHEFLPDTDPYKPEAREVINELAQELGIKPSDLRKKIIKLKEANPMLGHRGVRLGVTNPELTQMSARAIIGAGCELAQEGVKAIPEIMIPVVAIKSELENQEAICRATAEQQLQQHGLKPEQLPYKIGTMIELPSAALGADELAEIAKFFSFGTNDLTQTTLGISRDDIAALLDKYMQMGLLKDNPFVTLHPKVIELIDTAVKRGRATKPDLEIGICGEHGRDPRSIEICHSLGLDYVSPSGDGVLIARLAAAQAAIKEKQAQTEDRIDNLRRTFAAVKTKKARKIEVVVRNGALGELDKAQAKKVILAMKKGGLYSLDVNFGQSKHAKDKSWSIVELIAEDEIATYEPEGVGPGFARVVAVRPFQAGELEQFYLALTACVGYRNLTQRDLVKTENGKAQAVIELFNSLKLSPNKMDMSTLQKLLSTHKKLEDLRTILHTIVGNFLEAAPLAGKELEQFLKAKEEEIRNI